MSNSPACWQHCRLVCLVFELFRDPFEVGLAILEIVEAELDFDFPQSDEEYGVLAAISLGRVWSRLELPEELFKSTVTPFETRVSRESLALDSLNLDLALLIFLVSFDGVLNEQLAHVIIDQPCPLPIHEGHHRHELESSKAALDGCECLGGRDSLSGDS